ncbi:MAG: hypothetical protein V4819_21160 [Verrucomicrobiota bacterium]
MGWARTLLLGDIGNRLDIADAEAEINRIERSQLRAQSAFDEKEREIFMLKDELGRQKLATQALTRFLIEKGIIEAAELADFISQVDAEDGVIDGKMTVDSATRRLQFQKKAIPGKSPGKIGND